MNCDCWFTCLFLPQDGELPVGKNFLSHICMPRAQQAAWNLGSTQRMQFDIWVACRKALDRLRNAAAAVIISLCTVELMIIFTRAAHQPSSQLASLLPLLRSHCLLWHNHDAKQTTPPSVLPAAVVGWKHAFLELWIERNCNI